MMKKLVPVLVLIVFLTSCGESTTAETKKEPEVSVEQKLAVIDDIYDTTDIKAVRIKVLLNDLAVKYGEPKDTIAEYTFRAKEVLNDRGIPETILNVLEQMKETEKLDNTSYKDVITLYLMLRVK